MVNCLHCSKNATPENGYFLRDRKSFNLEEK